MERHQFTVVRCVSGGGWLVSKDETRVFRVAVTGKAASSEARERVPYLSALGVFTTRRYTNPRLPYHTLTEGRQQGWRLKDGAAGTLFTNLGSGERC